MNTMRIIFTKMPYCSIIAITCKGSLVLTAIPLEYISLSISANTNAIIRFIVTPATATSASLNLLFL